tara:strand:- start:5003 stop:5140 length:138 start_codon:yes stop_codon:yes gene_type:complete
MILSKPQMMTVVATVLLIAAMNRIEVLKPIILPTDNGGKKFLGIF